MITGIEEMNKILKRQARTMAASVYATFAAFAVMITAAVMKNTGVISARQHLSLLFILLVIYNVTFVILMHSTTLPFERNSRAMQTVRTLNREGFSSGYMWTISNNISKMPPSPARDFLLITAAESHIHLGEFDRAYYTLSGVSQNRSPEIDLLYRSCFMLLHFETGSCENAAAVCNDIMTRCANADFRKTIAIYSDMYMSETKMLYINGNYNEYISRSEAYIDLLSKVRSGGSIPMNTKQGIAMHRTSIAEACMRIGCYDKALYHLSLAIPDLSELPYRLNKALSLNNDVMNAMKGASENVHSR